MSDPSPEAASRPGAWPSGLAGMLVLVVALELLVMARDRFASPTAEHWKTQGAEAFGRAKDAEILCFGDSIVTFGIAPRVLEKQLGKRTYNLALQAGPPSASYVLLRRVLEAGGRPRTILFDLMPHQLEKSPLHAEFRRSWPELLSSREGLELAWECRNAEFLASILLARGLPSYKARYEIRTCVLMALQGKSYSVKDAVRSLRRAWRANLGTQVMVEGFREPTTPDPFPYRMTPGAGSYDPLTLAYARRFLRLAASHQIAVFWLLPPLGPEVQDWRDPRNGDSAYLQLVRSFQAEFPNLVVVDGRQSNYHRNNYFDAVHLNSRGVKVLSAELVGLLGEPPRGGSWVELPRHHEGTAEAPAEDRIASRRAPR